MARQDETTDGTDFQLLNANVTLELNRWLLTWKSWEDGEIFAHPEYVRLFADPQDSVNCAVLSSEAGTVLYPFILRKLSTDQFSSLSKPAADITSPYGYGGAYLLNGTGSHDLGTEFWTRFDTWAHDNRVVSEFVRLDLFQDAQVPYPGQRIERSTNVVRPLHCSEEEIWLDYEHKVRKNVKKAQRAGVTIEVDADGNRLEEFLAIYTRTMDRRSANESYYFSNDFFEQLNRTLAGSFVYFHALVDGQIVSTELVLVSARNVYSFLGGTDSDAFSLRPNDLIKHQIALWAKEHGKTTFVLGGGYAPDDGIFRYKRSFAPNGLVPFYTGERILNQQLYDELVKVHGKGNSQLSEDTQAFFPAYRA